MNHIIKKILLRTALLIILLIAMNYIYQQFFHEQDIQKHSSVVNKVRVIPNDADVIYIGESSNITTRGDDKDKRSISQMVDDMMPDLALYDITRPASHAGNYKVLLSQIPEESQVKTIIVTLNIRSFNAQWIYSDLETALEKSMVMLKDRPALYNRFVLSFKGYDIKTAQEREKQFKRKWKKDKFQFPYEFPHRDVSIWDSYMWNNGVKNPDGSKNDELSVLACHYIKGYAFQIDTLTNPRIQDFRDIMQLAQDRGWNLIFNLMAENTEKAQKLVGDDLMFLFEENRKLLVNFFESKGYPVVDNLYSVEDEQFIDQNWTTEHYAQKGRTIIAENVASELRLLHPKR